MTGRHLLPGLALVSLSVLLAGCQTPPQGGAPVTRTEDELAAAIDRHNQRLERLPAVEARGVLELEWVDDQMRRHVEPQINARLWIEGPRHTALRGEKLGEVLFWLGSDDEIFWMFDLLSDRTSLFVGRHDAANDVAGLLLPIRPLGFLDLTGMTALLPPGEWTTDASESLAYDVDRDVWTFETLDEEGRPIFRSTLSRYRPVDLVGQSRIGLPRMPTVIDIADAEGMLAVKVAFDPPTGRDDSRAWSVEFDLDRIVESMPTDETRGDRR